MDGRRDINVLATWLLQAGDQLRAAGYVASLSPGEVAALVLVSNDPGRSVDWLRARLSLSHSGTVRLVDRLSAQNLLERGIGREDGRTVALNLTARGAELVERIHAARSKEMSRLLEDVPADVTTALLHVAEHHLRARSRSRVEADVTCRLCDYRVCIPTCPVDDSIVDPSPPLPPRQRRLGIGDQ